MIDEARTLRRRHDDLLDDVDTAVAHAGAHGAALLVKTTTKTSYPTVAGVFYYVQYQTASGTETEGGAGTLTADSAGLFYALNLGSAIPPAGTAVIAVFSDSLWTFRYDG